MFKPWIGLNYFQSTKPRVLILGESHYGDAHIRGEYPLEEKTILCIQQQIDNTWRGRFYTKIVSMFIGHKPAISEKHGFWQSVSYHNLITEPLLASRKAPSQEQWRYSIQTLPTILKELAPDYCVILGYRMWGQLRDKFDFAPVKFNSDIGPCGAVASDSFKCLFHGIKHPSGRGYRSSIWHDRIQNLLHENPF